MTKKLLTKVFSTSYAGKDYFIYLSDFARIIIYFSTDKNAVKNFVVKLEFIYRNDWIEIERFDCYHGSIHKDILNRKGGKKRIVNYGDIAKKMD